MKQNLLIIGLFIVAMVFWNSVFLYPLKIFIVCLHEIGHAAAAVISGGQALKIELSPMLGGVCWHRGGNPLLVIPAGYLGSLFFGGIILLLAAKTNLDKFISIILGGVLIFITLFLIRGGFGFTFGLAFGAGLILIGFFAPTSFNDIILRFIGLTSMLYSVIDIKDDLIVRTVPGSDAYAMSEIIPLPPVAWGIIWVLISLFFTYFFLKLSINSKKD